MRDKRQAFTLMELMVVVGIIAILMGVLLPALNVVQRTARNTKQKAQLTTIGLAITTFKNDFGDYPPSRWKDPEDKDYSGAQKLAEAMVGWDLMGFHPESDFRSDGKDKDDNWVYIDPDTFNPDDPDDQKNLEERKERYLELESANVFRLGDKPAEDKPGLFEDCQKLWPYTYVICDIFGKRRITLAAGNTVRAGTPILYYKANTNFKKHMDTSPSYSERIYNVFDNQYLVDLRPVTVTGKKSDREHPLENSQNNYYAFYDFITDKKMPNLWPYRPDSYILISAGVDGEYGTSDDVTNFK